MIYELAFVESALKEWRKLAPAIRNQFKAKLKERLVAPRVASSRLHGLVDCYKIKLRAAGYRLVYEVDDRVVLVTVVAVGKRDRGVVYISAGARVSQRRRT
ncbi:MAG TPA: type II toxin-antitoxin system RelE/ParE family toxin [Rhodanobacteraceae bacterium]|nr:type II toxin-antitoxin system RelE/ParE family toxin [Rhodanobacteraceae bacterium]